MKKEDILGGIYEEEVIPEFSGRKRFLDLTSMELKGRTIKLSPMFLSPKIYMDGNNNYLADKLSLLYYVVSYDETAAITSVATSKNCYRKYNLKRESNRLVLEFPNGLSFSVILSKKVVGVIDSISGDISVSSFTFIKMNSEVSLEKNEYINEISTIAYLFNRLLFCEHYGYPLPLIDDKTKFTFIEHEDRVVLLSHVNKFEGSKKLLRKTKELSESLSSLKEAGIALNDYRTEKKIPYSLMSKLLMVTVYVNYMYINKYDIASINIFLASIIKRVLISNKANIKTVYSVSATKLQNLDYGELSTLLTNYVRLYKDTVSITNKTV